MTRTFLLFIAMSLFKNTNAQDLYIVDRGCIKDNFSIRFVDQNFILEPDKFFSLSKINLQVSKIIGNPAKKRGKDNFNSEAVLKYYTNKKVISYKISITRNDRTYYGRIAFFGVEPKHKNDAVATYYKISIPEDYFSQARDGMKTCVYEYYMKDDLKIFTWAIWLSDVPLD
jgi:hypothetical protein